VIVLVALVFESKFLAWNVNVKLKFVTQLKIVLIIKTDIVSRKQMIFQHPKEQPLTFQRLLEL